MNYIHKIFLESPEGKAVVDAFTFKADEDELWDKKLETIYSLVEKKEKDYYNAYSPDVFVKLFNLAYLSIRDFLNQNEDVAKIEDEGEFYSQFMGGIELYYWGHETEESKEIVPLSVFCSSGDLRLKASYIPQLSIAMYAMWEESLYYPILFNQNYQVFENRCNYLGIELPGIPLQKNPDLRLLYYYDVCCILDKYRAENELTKAQLCALLYSFAPNAIGDNDDNKVQVDNLPAPTRIWLTGASKNDYKAMPDITENVWACNEATRRGDIIVVYAVAPNSCIHSVWRAGQDGNVNPFDYWCNRSLVVNKIEVPHISFKELTEDPYMKNVSIVRRKLRGINGVELKIEDYNQLLRMFEAKGFDTSVLPRIEAPEIDFAKDCKIEKDVEEKLLIPLLEKLGYSSEDGKDWTRQVIVKFGRKEKAIPDFVFFKDAESQYQVKAPFLIEAKYDMYNNNERQKAYNQGMSYANPLSAKMFGICDKNIIRIYKRKKEAFRGEQDLVFDHTWYDLLKPEIFNELQKLIGRDVVAKMK